jgi:DNA-binding NtrC family response regulator
VGKLKNLKEKANLKQELNSLREEVQGKYDFFNILKGNSSPMQRIFKLMEKSAKTNITVSITGETGTGKELVAKAIHYNSPRKKKPLVAVNNSAIPNELIESELFGHKKGAFTGANARRIGKFEEANNGTIFLDEIREMDINMQAKLLRVLQEREVTRVGGNTSVKVDVRVIEATHRNLSDEVKKGNFREDLFYRLLGFPIELPPLRERDNDVLLLAKFFLDDFAKENKLGKISFSAEAKEKLKRYPFPGNVRELKAVMDLTVVMSSDGIIQDEDISFRASNAVIDFLTEEMTLKEYNNRIIKNFLKRYDNNVLKVADKLDIGKSTIYRMIQEEKEK